MDAFTSGFSATFLAVLKVFLIIVAAGVLVRCRIVTQDHITSITVVTINVFLPCLNFSNVVRTFDPATMRLWWVLPLVAAASIGLGLLLGVLVFRKQLPEKKNMLCLAGLPNAGYLILPIGMAMYDAAQYQIFTTYCFLYILMVNPLLWSLGKYLSTSRSGEKLQWQTLITPPFVANILAVAMVLTKTQVIVPNMLVDSMDMLGQAAVPSANFVLGAVLGSIAPRFAHHLRDALKTMSVRLMLVPLITVVVLYCTGMNKTHPFMGEFFVLQSASAPATALILQIRKYGGDEQKFSTIMLIHYLVCILSMPLWVALWRVLPQ
jgi:malate permease and related proteins